MKTCFVCHEARPLEDFHRDAAREDGRRSTCKPCRALSSRWEKLEARYSLSREEFYKLLDEQDGRCAICLTHLPKGTAVVDHCHETGVVRGLLCTPCNLGLGHFKDGREPFIFDQARAYVTKCTPHPFNPSTGC